MLGSDKNVVSMSAHGAVTKDETYVHEGTTLEGKIRTDGSVTVCGKVHGDVAASTITISEGAVVKGALKAERITIRGRYEGDAACEYLKITVSGKVKGSFTQKTLEVESGALIEGNVISKAAIEPTMPSEIKKSTTNASSASGSAKSQ